MHFVSKNVFSCWVIFSCWLIHEAAPNGPKVKMGKLQFFGSILLWAYRNSQILGNNPNAPKKCVVTPSHWAAIIVNTEIVKILAPVLMLQIEILQKLKKFVKF